MFTDILLLLEQTAKIDQDKSEAILALMTLLYQADGKVRMQEQDTFSRIMAELPWSNPGISKEAFHRNLVSKSLNALATNRMADYLFEFVPALNSDGKVLAILRELANSDGDLDLKEVEIIRQVSKLMV
jgi:uncharacterized tellurite resistance protein B-like protein